MDYFKLMERATDLRQAAETLLCDNTPRAAAVRRIVKQLDDLVETAYETGDNEGFVRGHGEGETLGKAEAECHKVSDEQWEWNRTH